MTWPGEYQISPDLRWADSLGHLVTLTDREFQVFIETYAKPRPQTNIAAGQPVEAARFRKVLLESHLQAGLTAAEHAFVISLFPKVQ